MSSHLFPETSIQVLGALANANYLEYMPWFSDLYHEKLEFDDGDALVPERPGFGFTFDTDYHRPPGAVVRAHRLRLPDITETANAYSSQIHARRDRRRRQRLHARRCQRLALAQAEPIRIGWLAALTGPSSAPAIGFNRGVVFAAEAINAAGGVKGRKIEIITRDTQGDPTKAVNATQEMISQLKVHAIWGPTNSGESLAVTPIMARAKMPNIHPCVVDSLIDPQKFPNAFRSRRRTRNGTTRCAATASTS